ncbi:MAG: PAS domain-containing protein [Alphaproteobacteria bacterium]
MPNADSERLALQLADDDFSGVDALFETQQLPTPILVWNPGANELEVRELRFLRGLWDQLRDGAELPVAPELSPELLRPALGHIMLLDVVDGGADFRYRLYGSKIAQRSGFDGTGKLTSEIGPSPFISTFFQACYVAAQRRRLPLFTAHIPPSQVEVQIWRRLILPLADKDGAVYRFLVGNVPGLWRSPRIVG